MIQDLTNLSKPTKLRKEGCKRKILSLDRATITQIREIKFGKLNSLSSLCHRFATKIFAPNNVVTKPRIELAFPLGPSSKFKKQRGNANEGGKEGGAKKVRKKRKEKKKKTREERRFVIVYIRRVLSILLASSSVSLLAPLAFHRADPSHFSPFYARHGADGTLLNIVEASVSHLSSR